MNVDSAMSVARPLCLQERPLSRHVSKYHDPTLRAQQLGLRHHDLGFSPGSRRLKANR